MPHFNPNAPGTLGLEWMAHLQGAHTLESRSMYAGAKLKSDTAETIANLWPYVWDVRGEGRYQIEVTEAGNEGRKDVRTSKFMPRADAHRDPAITNEAGGTTNLWQKVASIGRMTQLDTNKYIQSSTSGGVGQLYTAFFDTSGQLAGRRIISVELVITGNHRFGENRTIARARLPNLTALGAGPGTDAVSAVTGGRLVRVPFSLGPEHPASGWPWTLAEFGNFHAGPYEAGLRFPVGGTRVYQMYLEVTHCEEHRVAVAVGTLSDIRWQSVPVRKPDGTPNWAKAAAKTYSYMMRRLGGSGALAWRWMDSRSPAPFGGSGFYGRWQGQLAGTKPRDASFVPVLAMTRDTGAVSPDSQAYAGPSAARVHAGRSPFQLVPGAAGTYGLVAVLVRRASPTVVADLTAQVVRHSDGVAIGGVATLTRAQFAKLRELKDGWRIWRGGLSAAAVLAAGTTYRVRFASAWASGQAVSGGIDAWEVLYLNSVGFAQAAGYGGTAAYFDPGGSLSASAPEGNWDAPVTLATSPPAVPSLTSLARRTTAGLGSVLLTWPSTTGLGAAFLHFEIDRWDAVVGDWQRVAELTDINRTAWEDWEPRKGLASTYRIRQRRTDQAPSAWTESGPATPSDAGGRWGFACNVAPDINRLYHVQEPRSYAMPDNQTVLEFYGRDGAVSFRGTEDRMDEHTLEVWVDQGDGRPGRAVFDSIRVTTRALVPYVCVTDPDGNRWFATLLLGEGAENWRDGFYTIPVTVRELTRQPVPAN